MNIFILQGVSGAGKSTYANRLLGESPEGAIVSADECFMVGGRYQFDPSKLGEAHSECKSPIIVDNTNARVDEIAPYYAIGEACGCLAEAEPSEIGKEAVFSGCTYGFAAHGGHAK